MSTSTTGWILASLAIVSFLMGKVVIPRKWDYQAGGEAVNQICLGLSVLFCNAGGTIMGIGGLILLTMHYVNH